MDKLTATPQVLKQANLSLIRRTIREKGTATRAEIAGETQISSTTIRSLLSELMENGEIESIGYDESSGGRKAERYRLKPDRYHGAVFCISGQEMHSLLINACGEILETRYAEVPDWNFEREIICVLDQLTSQMEIKTVGIGVPGIVEGGSYWKKSLTDDSLYRVDIGERISEKYGIPVVLENNLNATTIGFGKCYQNQYPKESPEDIHMAYLHFSKGCVSAGFIAGGRIIRGCHNFAGELGLVPMEDGRFLDACMADEMDDAQYTKLIARVIYWICAILNPQYIALAGSDLRTECIGPIGDIVYSYLEKPMVPEILYSSDVWQDYYHGMVSLTTERMFDQIQLIKA